MFPALAGRFSTTAPPGKPHPYVLFHIFFNWEKEKRDLFLALIPKGVLASIFFRVDDSAGHGEGEMHKNV